MTIKTLEYSLTGIGGFFVYRMVRSASLPLRIHRPDPLCVLHGFFEHRFQILRCFVIDSGNANQFRLSARLMQFAAELAMELCGHVQRLLDNIPVLTLGDLPQRIIVPQHLCKAVCCILALGVVHGHILPANPEGAAFPVCFVHILHHDFPDACLNIVRCSRLLFQSPAVYPKALSMAFQ